MWGCTVLLEIGDGSLDDGGYAGLEGVEDRISSRTEPAARHTQAGMLFHCVGCGGGEGRERWWWWVGEGDDVVETSRARGGSESASRVRSTFTIHLASIRWAR